MSKDNGHDPAVSVVVPVKNEAGNITPLVAEIAAALHGHAFEIVYVNDGSSDATEQELLGLMAQRPWLRQIRHDKSHGKSAALRTGVTMARAPTIVTLDGDCQNDPAVIPTLLDTLEKGAPHLGLAVGQRVGRETTVFKKMQSRIANSMRRALLKDGARDAGCAIRAFPTPNCSCRCRISTVSTVSCSALVRREGLRYWLCRCRRTAAPLWGFELRHVESTVGWHSRHCRCVVADPPQEARSPTRGGGPSSWICSSVGSHHRQGTGA